MTTICAVSFNFSVVSSVSLKNILTSREISSIILSRKWLTRVVPKHLNMNYRPRNTPRSRPDSLGILKGTGKSQTPGSLVFQTPLSVLLANLALSAEISVATGFLRNS